MVHDVIRPQPVVDVLSNHDKTLLYRVLAVGSEPGPHPFPVHMKRAKAVAGRFKNQFRKLSYVPVHHGYKVKGGFETCPLDPCFVFVLQRVLIRLKADYTIQLDIRKFINPHLINRFLAQFRDDIRNIIPKYFIGRQDRYVPGAQPVFIPVKQKRNPMQGNGRLSGPGHPLYDQCLRLIIPDYLVLFLLYGGNNGFHLLIRGVA